MLGAPPSTAGPTTIAARSLAVAVARARICVMTLWWSSAPPEYARWMAVPLDSTKRIPWIATFGSGFRGDSPGPGNFEGYGVKKAHSPP